MHWVGHLPQAAPCLTGWRMCCQGQRSRSRWVYRDKAACCSHPQQSALDVNAWQVMPKKAVDAGHQSMM
jgi:hypothetical protein